jgi:hypothetical protein
MTDHHTRSTARARRAARAVILWRQYGGRAALAGVPRRLLTDTAWVERHLLAPRERIAHRRIAAQIQRVAAARAAAAGRRRRPPADLPPLEIAPAQVVELIELGSSDLIGYRARCVWGHHWIGAVHVIGTELNPREAAVAEAVLHDAEHHTEAAA